jgi:hypothetical protein
MILLEMQGISMAPALTPGDVLMVDEKFPMSRLRFGDVVVQRNITTGAARAHRVIGASMATKGDRNDVSDAADGIWTYEGKVVSVHKKQVWRKLRFGSWMGLRCKYGLFPGQKLPSWTGRAFWSSRAA